jgi:hypothetical protein
MNWLGFEKVGVETLAILIRAIRNHYEQTGAWPTATQLLAGLDKTS